MKDFMGKENFESIAVTDEFLPWSLIGAEISDAQSDINCAVTEGTGTATHTRDQPKDLHVDDS